MCYSIIKKRGKVAALDEEIQGMSDTLTATCMRTLMAGAIVVFFFFQYICDHMQSDPLISKKTASSSYCLKNEAKKLQRRPSY